MRFEECGFAVLDEWLSHAEREALLRALSTLSMAPLRGGIRRIERMLPQVANLAYANQMMDLVKNHLTGLPRLVRAIYFDKSPANNWFVTWHQDKTVAVSQRFTADGWGPWSLKANAWHVQPPLAVLENMLTVRIHLDPANKNNGCLKVIPGSHRDGLLNVEQIREQTRHPCVIYCEVPAGGAFIMRPLLVHASEKISTPCSRRVLHFEYSGHSLPAGIAWSA
jgi:hypothetical protein